MDPLLLIITIASIGIAVTLITIVLTRRSRGGERLKYEFITIIAHKFRTPLTQMKWLSEGLLGNETDPYKKERLAELAQANQGLISLTGTLIELTDSDRPARASYHFERVPLCQFVRDISDFHKNSFHEKNIFFSVQCPAEEIYADADRERLSFILETLLENARTYTPPGKKVDVVVSTKGGVAKIAVIDAGIGIAQADLSRVFSKFFRAENARSVDTEGFGVALYLAQTIARRHGGRIEASSEGQGKGSVFTLVLRRLR